MDFNENDFRRCMGCFTTGVTVVTTKGTDLKPYGVTINSFSSVSLSPPLVLFSLEKEAHIYKHFVDSNQFTVNILSEEQKDISQNFAHPTTANWENTPHIEGINNCPIIKGVAAYIECSMKTIYEGGDHSIIIGEVTSLKADLNVKPLLYNQGKYMSIGSDI